MTRFSAVSSFTKSVKIDTLRIFIIVGDSISRVHVERSS